MPGLRNSTRDRRLCFEAHKQTDAAGRVFLICHLCGRHLDPVREPWEAEHVLRRSLDRDNPDDPQNILPAHTYCHTPKTANDIRDNAKGKRVSDRHFGIKRSQGFRRILGMKYNWLTRRYERGD